MSASQNKSLRETLYTFGPVTKASNNNNVYNAPQTGIHASVALPVPETSSLYFLKTTPNPKTATVEFRLLKQQRESASSSLCHHVILEDEHSNNTAASTYKFITKYDFTLAFSTTLQTNTLQVLGATRRASASFRLLTCIARFENYVWSIQSFFFVNVDCEHGRK